MLNRNKSFVFSLSVPALVSPAVANAFKKLKKVKLSRYRPGQALGVPGG
jgi:hypothetical protein